MQLFWGDDAGLAWQLWVFCITDLHSVDWVRRRPKMSSSDLPLLLLLLVVTRVVRTEKGCFWCQYVFVVFSLLWNHGGCWSTWGYLLDACIPVLMEFESKIEVNFCISLWLIFLVLFYIFEVSFWVEWKNQIRKTFSLCRLNLGCNYMCSFR